MSDTPRMQSGFVAYTKQLMRAGLGSEDIDGQIEREAERFGERLFSDEVRSIMQRFLPAKRA